MKVFISWSKQVSQQVAEALRDWLPLVIQDVEPWMSKADLEAGVRWGQELSARLQEIDFGIVCIIGPSDRPSFCMMAILPYE
jgi:hypothetical protein